MNNFIPRQTELVYRKITEENEFGVKYFIEFNNGYSRYNVLKSEFDKVKPKDYFHFTLVQGKV